MFSDPAPFPEFTLDESAAASDRLETAEPGRIISPSNVPYIFTTPNCTFPEILLLTNVSELAETLASPVLIVEVPPVFRLESLLPEFAVRTKLFPTAASLFWNVLLFDAVSMFALLVEFVPFPVLAEDDDCVQPEIQLAANASGVKTISPLWSSAILNSDTIKPSTLVFTEVTAVPEVLESPVIIAVSPLLYEDWFEPVADDCWLLLLICALLF